MRTVATICLLACLLALGSCGGGGGETVAVELAVDFQTLRGPGTRVLTAGVENTFGASATLAIAEAPQGPFALGQKGLPRIVGPGEIAEVDIAFTPSQIGPVERIWKLRLASGGEEIPVRITLRANWEGGGLTPLDAPLDFGDVPVGTSKTLVLRLANDSSPWMEEITGLLGLGAEFDFPGLPQPAYVPPGTTLDLPVRFTPAALASHDLTLYVRLADDARIPVPLRATASSWADDIVTDFGVVSLPGGTTDYLTVHVPPDAISLSIEAWGQPTDTFGVLSLVGPDGHEYEAGGQPGLPFGWYASGHVLVATLPNNDRPDEQLQPGGGAYRFRLSRLQGSSASCRIRAIVKNRPGAVATPGVVDLNVYLAAHAAPVAATAPTHVTLQAILKETDRLLRKAGIQVGAVSYFDVDKNSYDAPGAAIWNLFQQATTGAPERRINLFFVGTVPGGNVGLSSRISGPSFNGTQMSGVAIDYDFSNSTTVGYAAAHEICHYLGLLHTSDPTLGFDHILDTLECPAVGVSTTCGSVGGGYLMHWSALTTSEPILTAGQARVMQGHPLVRRAAGLSVSPLLVDTGPRPPLDAAALPPGWCGHGR